jgi:YkoY family integral membrane protein
VDNALVLATMVSALPKDQQKKALKYGIWGAFIFRIIAVLLAVWLIKLWWFKLLGGAYLLWVAYHGLKPLPHAEAVVKKTPGFWIMVAQVELMDIAFSVDSILAAVALSDNKYVVIMGGILGIIAMRYAAGVFIKLLERYPIFKKTAYVLLLVIGAKLVASVWWHPPHWLFFGALFAILGISLMIGKRRHYPAG